MITSQSSIIINETSLAPSDTKTFFVLGVARGGTSAVAGSLRDLGISMGTKGAMIDRFGEDIAFRDLNPTKVTAQGNFRKYVRDRNKENDIWGLKLLNVHSANKNSWAAFEKKELYDKPYMRNLHFILIVRDFLSGFLGEEKARSRGMPNLNRPFPAYLDTYLNYYDHFKYLINHEKKYPMMITSYEKMILNPEDYMNNLVTFLQNREYLIKYEEDKQKFTTSIKPVSKFYWEG